MKICRRVALLSLLIIGCGSSLAYSPAGLQSNAIRGGDAGTELRTAGRFWQPTRRGTEILITLEGTEAARITEGAGMGKTGEAAPTHFQLEFLVA